MDFDVWKNKVHCIIHIEIEQCMNPFVKKKDFTHAHTPTHSNVGLHRKLKLTNLNT